MEKTIEKFQFIFLVAGVGFFVFAFIVSGVVTVNAVSDLPYTSLVELSEDVSPYFIAEALNLGRNVYIGEACWHCHSQQVRPVANEDVRWGPVSQAAWQQNELMLPQLMGTRRVGPDLTWQTGVHSNDWHVAHFYNPRSVSPVSIMPSYTWFFDSNKEPNKRGLAIITYMQWLGSNVE
jgi:cbb3-type cytochrome c oxidase subunit II